MAPATGPGPSWRSGDEYAGHAGSRRRLRQQDDLAENVALRESPVGVLNRVERERRRDGQLQLSGRDQAREFGEHARGGRGRVAIGVDPVPCDGFEVDDRVDAGRLDAEL